MKLPTHKADVETARRLAECSIDELEPILAEILTWIQDYNWPVAKILGPVLANCDDRIVTHVRAVLASAWCSPMNGGKTFGRC